MSVGVSRLAEWINKDLNYDDSTKVKIVPISDKFTTGKLKNKYVRTIEFSFANMDAPSNDDPLYSIINSIGRYNGVNAKIAISVGHVKDAQLNPKAAYDLIRDIQCNSGIIGVRRQN